MLTNQWPLRARLQNDVCERSLNLDQLWLTSLLYAPGLVCSTVMGCDARDAAIVSAATAYHRFTKSKFLQNPFGLVPSLKLQAQGFLQFRLLLSNLPLPVFVSSPMLNDGDVIDLLRGPTMVFSNATIKGRDGPFVASGHHSSKEHRAGKYG